MSPWTDAARETRRDLRSEKLGPAWIDRGSPPWTETVISGEVAACEPSGAARASLLAAIAEAREVIALQSFLLGDVGVVDALEAAAGRGVRVYILTTENVTDDLSEASEFTQEIRERHKVLLNRVAGRVLLRTASHLHAKYLLVDPDGERARGFISTANFNKEALTENRELLVRLTGEETRAAFALFTRTFWSEATHELLEPNKFHTTRPFPASQFVGGPLLATAKDVRTLRDEVERLVKAADSLTVSAWGFTATHRLVMLLAQRAKDGCPVTVLMPTRHQNSEAAGVLARAGATILATGRGFGKLHAKIVSATTPQGTRAIVMTANFERRGLDEGSEIGILLDGARADSVAAIAAEWKRTFPYAFTPSALVGDVKGKALLPRGKEMVEVELGGEETIELAPASPRSLFELDASPALRPLDLASRTKIVHEEHYRWLVRIPRLPAGAQPQGERDGFPLYAVGSKRYLVVDDPEKLRAAATAARAADATPVAPAEAIAG